MTRRYANLLTEDLQAIHHPLLECLLHQRVEIRSSVLMRFDDYPCCGWFGTLLTKNKRFLEFEIHIENEKPVVERWEDVTDVQNLNGRNVGIGAGEGFLALQVLADLQETV